MIDILIPTLGRGDVLRPLVDNVFDTTRMGDFRLLFVLDRDDPESYEAMEDVQRAYGDTDVNLLVCDGTYPEKINFAYRHSFGDLVLPTADDVRFHEGWLEAVELALPESAPNLAVAGTDDLSPATADRSHATMPVLRRSYIEDPGAVWGEAGTVFHGGYRHNFCETELWQLALHRGVTVWAEGAVIEHLHPAWGTREVDDTDRKGNQQGWEEDEALFKTRRDEWLRS